MFFSILITSKYIKMLLKHNYLKSLFIYLITYLTFTILQSALFKGVLRCEKWHNQIYTAASCPDTTCPLRIKCDWLWLSVPLNGQNLWSLSHHCRLTYRFTADPLPRLQTVDN